MDTQPYKEKGPPRRRAPVRNPRPKKDPEPTVTSLITESERAKIRSGQAKLIAETEKASAIAIQNAIRSNLARKVVKNAKSSTISYEKVMNILDDYIPDYLKKEKNFNEIKYVIKSMVDYANKNPNPKSPGFAEGTGFVKLKGRYYGHMNDQMKKINDMPVTIDKSSDDIRYINNVIKDINVLTLEIHNDNRRSNKPKNEATVTPKVKNEIVPKKPKNEIVAKKPKNEIVPKTTAPAAAKPTKERKAKINYKMSYAAAVKAWNTSRGNAMWCNPRKNSDEYKAVQALRL
jgi:hypothetical protein